MSWPWDADFETITDGTTTAKGSFARALMTAIKDFFSGNKTVRRLKVHTTNGASAIAAGDLDVENNATVRGNLTLPAGDATINGDVVVGDDLTVGDDITATNGNLKGEKLAANSTAVFTVGGAPAGTGGTITGSTGSDMGGLVVLNTGTTCTAPGKVATVTFSSAYGTAPKSVTIHAQNFDTLQVIGSVRADLATTAKFDLYNDSAVPLTDSKTFKWYYQVTF